MFYVLTRRTYRRHSFGMPAGVFWTRLAGRFQFLQHLDRKFIGADWKRSKVKDKKILMAVVKRHLATNRLRDKT